MGGEKATLATREAQRKQALLELKTIEDAGMLKFIDQPRLSYFSILSVEFESSHQDGVRDLAGATNRRAQHPRLCRPAPPIAHAPACRRSSTQQLLRPLRSSPITNAPRHVQRHHLRIRPVAPLSRALLCNPDPGRLRAVVVPILAWTNDLRADGPLVSSLPAPVRLQPMLPPCAASLHPGRPRQPTNSSPRGKPVKGLSILNCPFPPLPQRPACNPSASRCQHSSPQPRMAVQMATTTRTKKPGSTGTSSPSRPTPNGTMNGC
ncbi:hypothetical protein K438DRAFT_375741 [Mycena galopus ATCC 62051]|nr:hypothetical protein K438DRAFT_375741 [Mycena galopus ATCC 62051]